MKPILCVRYYSKCITYIAHLWLRATPQHWPCYYSCFIDREMEALRTLVPSLSTGAKSLTSAAWCPYCVLCSFNHLFRLFGCSLQHWNKIPLLSIWVVVQLGFLLPACCYSSSLPQGLGKHQQGMEHLVLISLPKQAIFLIYLLWGGMFLQLVQRCQVC